MYVSKVYEMAVDSYGDVRTLVRGLPYQCPDDWEDVLDSLDEGSNLYLIKEPDNPKDKLAIATYLDDRRVGYVAASDSRKIWLYMTDEKMPCTFIERFEASFKISFDNPRSQFEGMSFEEIYRDKDGVTEEPYADFEIPFLTNPKDKNYDWYDDQTYIMDLEKFIPDFRRKLAARLIVLAGRKNSEGDYCYYLPYSNNPIADIDNDTIKGLIDEHGFVVALPDVPMKTERGGIIMDLHVTYLTGIIFWAFDSMHQSEFVFHLTQETFKQPNTTVKKSAWRVQSVRNSDEQPTKNIEKGVSYEVTDSSEGGKHVSMDVIIPEDGDEDFDFCTYECRISEIKQIDIITKFMKRFEEGKEPRPFLMIGRPCFGLDNIDIFYSLDGEIIFNFIFDENIKSWIREAGFVLGKVKSYQPNSLWPNELDIALTVSKRKSGETLFKQASEEAMDYIEETTESTADYKLEGKIIDAVNDYLNGKSKQPYKVLVIPKSGYAVYTTLKGKEIAIAFDYEIQQLAEDNKGAVGFITDFEYDDDEINVEFTIRVSRSIPRPTLDAAAFATEDSNSTYFSNGLDGNQTLSPNTLRKIKVEKDAHSRVYVANDYFTQEHLKSFYPGVTAGGYYRTVYQIFDDLPDVEFEIVEMSNTDASEISISYSELLEEEFLVVGLRHHDYYDAHEEKVVGLKVGDELELVKEPDNPSDPNAIAVYFKGKCVGYISRNDTEDVSELMSMSNDFRFYVSSEPFGSVQATLSVNAHVNRKIGYKNHVIVKAKADVPNEIFAKYKEYINALIEHDFILRGGYNNQLEFEAKRHRFFGRLNSKYLNVRAEQNGPLEGKLVSLSITDEKQVQIEFELAFGDLKPRQSYEKLVWGLTSFFKEFEREKTYEISLRELNELNEKRKTRAQYVPFIKYIQEYYLINLIIQD